jgi:peptidoglycan/xylan/chitin deacetylase (PgdA/CDA1 family)
MKKAIFLFLIIRILCHFKKHIIDFPYNACIYLTFDNDPDSIYTPLTLDVLKEKNIKVTF